MIEDLPIISINVKIFKFWSLLLVHNWRRYISIISVLFLNVTQLLDMFYSNEPIDATIRNSYFLVLWFTALIRALFLIVNRYEFENFMVNLERMYFEIQKNGDRETQELLDETTRNARKMSIFNMFLGVMVDVGFVLYPLFTKNRVLPFGLTIPGINKYEQPYYAILYLLQGIITPVGCCLYMPFTGIFVVFMMFGSVLAKNLQYRLRRLKEKSDTDKMVMIKMDLCVRYHNQLIKYATQLNDLFTYIFLVEFITSGATICALLFLLNIVKSFAQAFFVCTYILMIIMQIFITYWYANELSFQTAEIATAAYDSTWLEFNTPTRKALVLTILRAQKPLSIMVGNVYPMTMQVFQSLLKAAYSFFTILRRVYS